MIHSSDGWESPFQMLEETSGSIYIDTCSLTPVKIPSNLARASKACWDMQS